MVSFHSGLARTALKVARTAVARGLATAAAGCLALGTALPAAEPAAVLDEWLAAQKQLQTWTADCRQTRALKTLTQPLVSTGKVWYAAPDRFRWELGQPAQTIAVRNGDELLVLYPNLKRAERYPLAGGKAGPWRDALGLLDAGFPRSREQLRKQFRIGEPVQTNGAWELRLHPLSAAASRFITAVHVDVSTNGCRLLATELAFADGSRMRNDFTNAVLNPKLDDALFSPKLGDDWKVTEPLSR